MKKKNENLILQKSPVLLQTPENRVSRSWFESQLWALRVAFRTAGTNEAELNIAKSLVKGFASWMLETVEGCGLKWISREAQRFLFDEHGVDPRLVVENFAIGKTFDRAYPDDLVLRNCLSNNLAGFEKRLTREHVVPISAMQRDLMDWNVPMEEILENDFDLALITAEEDRALSKAGYKSKRPGGWRECYKKCGIEVRRLAAAF